MISTEVRIAANKFRSMEASVEKMCEEAGLLMRSKRSLKGHPDSLHWHYKKGSERGTLEITLWKKERRLWFIVHENRKGAWINGTIKALKPKLES